MRKNDEALYQELYANVTHVIRSGNYNVAVLLLSNPPAKVDPEFYTR